jgi:cyclohexyl-isocyanide hydratase
MTFGECPKLDVIACRRRRGQCLLEDTETLAFIRAQAKQARYVTSVCTGSLVLGAAGLLRAQGDHSWFSHTSWRSSAPLRCTAAWCAMATSSPPAA